MAFCTECGSQLAEEHKFCASCGTANPGIEGTSKSFTPDSNSRGNPEQVDAASHPRQPRESLPPTNSEYEGEDFGEAADIWNGWSIWQRRIWNEAGRPDLLTYPGKEFEEWIIDNAEDEFDFENFVTDFADRVNSSNRVEAEPKNTIAPQGLGFGEAIKSFFGNYANFRGRARRSEYWYAALFLGLTGLATALFDALLGTFGVLYWLWILAILVPSLAVTVRRLHDIDRSGAWYFLNLVPLVGPIILFVFMCQDSKPGENEYGEPVK